MRSLTKIRLRDENDGDGGDLGGAGDEGTGFQDASAANLADLLGDDFASATAPASRPEGIAMGSDPTPPPEPVQPVTPPAQPPAQPPVEPVTPPAEPVAAQPPAQPPTEPQPQAQPPVQPVQPPAEPQPPAQPEKTPEQVAAERQQHRQQFVEQLTQAYAIPEAEVEELRDTPEQYLPKVAAKLHADIFDSLYHGLVQQLPQLVDHLMTSRTAKSADEERFFQKWGKLNTPELRGKALEKVRQYRQLNPTMPTEQFQHEAGMWAHMALRVPLDVPAAPGNGNGQGAQPSAPPQPPRQAPFQPAGASSTTGGVPLAPTKDPWGAWVDEMAQDG